MYMPPLGYLKRQHDPAVRTFLEIPHPTVEGAAHAVVFLKVGEEGALSLGARGSWY